MGKKKTKSEWRIQDWFPKGHKVMDTSVEGSFKTMTGCYAAVCVASGNRFFGETVEQGPVLIVDEETPEADLVSRLNRLALGFDYKSWHDLPIEVLSMTGFRFGRKTELDRLLTVVDKVKPALIRIDSVLACLPGGRQGMGENNSETGIAIKDDLNTVLQAVPECTIMISAHSRKFVAELGLAELRQRSIESMIRGHGSIAGEACDTGLILKRISSYPDATRFVILTRARRRAIPMGAKDVFVELEEQEYGKGWAKLKRIAPVVLPPSKLASDLFPLFKDEPVKASDIIRAAAFYTKEQCRVGVEELLERRVIQKAAGSPFAYKLNPYRQTQVDSGYLAKLEAARTVCGS